MEQQENEEKSKAKKFGSLIIEGTRYKTLLTKKYINALKNKYNKPNPKKIYLPISGTIVKVNVKPGDNIKKNDGLLVFESMKMENRIFSSISGTVKSVFVKKLEFVESGTIVIELE